MSTAGFKGACEDGLIEQFLHDPEHPENLLKGPWLEIKLPFRIEFGCAARAHCFS